MFAAVGVPANFNKQRGILLHGRVAAAVDDTRDDERVSTNITGVVEFERGRTKQRDHGGRIAHPQRRAVAVARAQHHALAGRRRAEADRRIERQPDAAGRQRDTRLDAQLSTIQLHHQTPADAAQANGAAQVEHRFAQPVLQVLQMFGRDAQAFYELGSCIVGHDGFLVGSEAGVIRSRLRSAIWSVLVSALG